jgi:hypothetical protein
MTRRALRARPDSTRGGCVRTLWACGHGHTRQGPHLPALLLPLVDALGQEYEARAGAPDRAARRLELPQRLEQAPPLEAYSRPLFSSA